MYKALSLRYFRVQCRPAQQLRWFSKEVEKSKEPTVKVDKTLLGKLRKRTRFPIQKCKEALLQNENNLVQAEKWMKEKAIEEGWQKSLKLGDRPMSQGLIGLVQEKQTLSLVEVNCETDFVARNDQFKNLVSNISNHCLRVGKLSSASKVAWSKEALGMLAMSEEATVSDSVVAAIGMIGENMAIPRAVFLRADNQQTIGCFVHSAGSSVESAHCNLGKFAAAVLIRPFDRSVQLPKNEMQQVARNLAQHVVGLKPTQLGSSLDRRKVGRDEEETRLLHQEFLFDEDMNVGQYCSQKNIVIDDFVRFECGEFSEVD